MTATSNLAHLRPGQSATVQSFNDSYYSGKFLEMGLLPGEQVRLEKVAPLGDPILISINGSFLSLRKSEAATVEIANIHPNGTH